MAVDDMLCFAAYSANLAFHRFYKPLLDRIGLTYPQFLVMMALWANDHQSVGGIGDSLGLDSSTLTPLIKRLEAGGFVTRERDAQDERQVRVTLTPAGLDLRDRCGCLGEEIIARSGMAIDDLQALRDEVRALRDALEQRGAETA